MHIDCFVTDSLLFFFFLVVGQLAFGFVWLAGWRVGGGRANA
jgi:hypothetical protein